MTTPPEKPLASLLDPWSILLRVAREVPAVRWALGVAGVAAAGAIAAAFFRSPLMAWLAISATLVFMVLLVLFNTVVKHKSMRVPGMVLVWFMLVLFIVVSTGFVSWAFTGHPDLGCHVFDQGCGHPSPMPSQTPTALILERLVSDTRFALANYENAKATKDRSLAVLRQVRDSAIELGRRFDGIPDQALPVGKILERDLYGGIAHTLAALSESATTISDTSAGEGASVYAADAIRVIDRGLGNLDSAGRLAAQPTAPDWEYYRDAYDWASSVGYRNVSRYNRALALAVLARQDPARIDDVRKNLDAVGSDYIAERPPNGEPVIVALCAERRETLGDRVCGE